MKIWVVEVCDKGKWSPTVGVGLTKEDANRRSIDGWKRQFPEGVRVRKYVPEDKEGVKCPE